RALTSSLFPYTTLFRSRMGSPPNLTKRRLRTGMVGLGMIFDDTYRPLFEQLHANGLYRRDFGLVDVELSAVATRTGARAKSYKIDRKSTRLNSSHQIIS